MFRQSEQIREGSECSDPYEFEESGFRETFYIQGISRDKMRELFDMLCQTVRVGTNQSLRAVFIINKRRTTADRASGRYLYLSAASQII